MNAAHRPLQEGPPATEVPLPVLFPHSWVENPPPMDDAYRAAGAMAEESDTLLQQMEDLKRRLGCRISARNVRVPQSLRRLDRR